MSVSRGKLAPQADQESDYEEGEKEEKEDDNDKIIGDRSDDKKGVTDRITMASHSNMLPETHSSLPADQLSSVSYPASPPSAGTTPISLELLASTIANILGYSLGNKQSSSDHDLNDLYKRIESKLEDNKMNIWRHTEFLETYELFEMLLNDQREAVAIVERMKEEEEEGREETEEPEIEEMEDLDEGRK
jgi:hypothetical protein